MPAGKQQVVDHSHSRFDFLFCSFSSVCVPCACLVSKLIPLRTVNHLASSAASATVVAAASASTSRGSLVKLTYPKKFPNLAGRDSTYGSLASTTSPEPPSPGTMSVGSWSTFSFGSNRHSDGEKPVMVKMAFKVDKSPKDPEKYQLTTTLKVLEFMCIFDGYIRYFRNFFYGIFTWKVLKQVPKITQKKSH